MIICEYSFNDPDAENPMYSFHEVDFYGHIPYPHAKHFPQHRLSLRKNLRTGNFEVYRYYHANDTTEVAFKGKLEEALKFAFKETRRFWGSLGRIEPDVVCQHKPPIIDSFWCPYARTEVQKRCRSQT